MSNDEQNYDAPSHPDWHHNLDQEAHPFSGFALPTSNTTYTPNQFFDVCLPHYSRGVVRLVGYMIRKTLGWCDRDGNPQDEDILVSYQDLVEHAGINRDMARQAIDEAIAGRFIRCVRQGRPNSAGLGAVTAIYQLRWDDGSEYVKDPKKFNGFFEGEGNRTDIPNQFFDYLIPSEPLSIIKAVGAVTRFSIGFQAKRGSRRQDAALSYRDIQNYTKISSPTALATALRTAIEHKYIVRRDAGYFDPNAGKQSRSATYCLRWADTDTYESNGRKSVAGENPAERSEKCSGNGRKSVAGERSEKCSGIQIKHINKTSKQQHANGVPAVAVESFEKLRAKGFDEKAATILATNFAPEVIKNQILWLDSRAPSVNPLGMLRKAIEENWPNPAEKVGSTQPSKSTGTIFAANFYAGFAGNRESPTAEPSASDAAAAERYVNRLQTVTPECRDFGQLGRSFGEYCRARFGNSPPAIVSAVACLRSYGDQFFVELDRKRSKARTTQAADMETARESHRRRFEKNWLEYLRSVEAKLQKDEPIDFARFEANRSEQAEKIRSSQWPGLAEVSLRLFNGEGQRFRDFQRFFAGAVLDFWRWDEQMNLDRFNGQQSRL